MVHMLCEQMGHITCRVCKHVLVMSCQQLAVEQAWQEVQVLWSWGGVGKRGFSDVATTQANLGSGNMQQPLTVVTGRRHMWYRNTQPKAMQSWQANLQKRKIILLLQVCACSAHCVSSVHTWWSNVPQKLSDTTNPSNHQAAANCVHRVAKQKAVYNTHILNSCRDIRDTRL